MEMQKTKVIDYSKKSDEELYTICEDVVDSMIVEVDRENKAVDLSMETIEMIFSRENIEFFFDSVDVLLELGNENLKDFFDGLEYKYVHELPQIEILFCLIAKNVLFQNNGKIRVQFDIDFIVGE